MDSLTVVHCNNQHEGFSQVPIFNWDVTEKVWLRAMYSDGIAAQTRKTEGGLKTEG